MKKLMTILVLFALCGVVMAAETVDPNAPVSLRMKTEEQTVYKTIEGRWKRNVYGDEKKYMTGETREVTGWNGKTYTEYYVAEHQVATGTKTVNVAQPYLNVKEDGTLGDSGLTYTVMASKEVGKKDNYNRQHAQAYFTTAASGPEGKVLAVQFLGAELEKKDTAGNVYPGSMKDYGIYLYDPETGNRISDYMKASEYGNYFSVDAGIKPNTSFGVFYIDGDGNYIASTGDGGFYGAYSGNFYERENGILGNFDDDSHDLKVYNKETGAHETKTTDKHFLCLSAGEYGRDGFKYNHFEFMLQTTWDDPYYPVNPNDFNDDVHIDNPVVHGNGQPLPGTLATLLIGGLCASSLRKKNKKH